MSLKLQQTQFLKDALVNLVHAIQYHQSHHHTVTLQLTNVEDSLRDALARAHDLKSRTDRISEAIEFADKPDVNDPRAQRILQVKRDLMDLLREWMPELVKTTYSQEPSQELTVQPIEIPKRWMKALESIEVDVQGKQYALSLDNDKQGQNQFRVTASPHCGEVY